MADELKTWRRYEELRPDELARMVADTPVLFWPLGLLEHHGWHLPVGYDGIKAERTCIRVAQRTGGVLLPVMWWGGGGGHGEFLWTMYESEEATATILVDTVEKVVDFGFRVVVLLAGHYPWQGVLDRCLPEIQKANPGVLFFWGTEVSICGDAVKLKGDHAAREETSLGLSLLPEFIDMDAMRTGRGAEVWPVGGSPAEENRHPGVKFDPDDPLFAQFGEDARTASVARGEAGIGQVVDNLAGKINDYLADIKP